MNHDPNAYAIEEKAISEPDRRTFKIAIPLRYRTILTFARIY